MRFFYPLLTIAFGLLGIWGARRVSREVRRRRGWPTAPGTILERGVGPAMGDGAFVPLVRYAYTVGGREYVNDQVYVIRRTGMLARGVRRLVDGLPDPVPVHYNPADPADSYLLAQPRSSFWLAAGFGAVATAVGLLMLLAAALGAG
jgi:hypothetical protein